MGIEDRGACRPVTSIWRPKLLLFAGTFLAWSVGVSARGPEPSGPSCGRFVPLEQINQANVRDLQIAWRRPAIDPQISGLEPDLQAPPYYRATAIEQDGVLYAPNGVGFVEAFDGYSGRTIWVQKPVKADLAELAGNSVRNVALWRGKKGVAARIISVRANYLYALDAASGAPIAGFGQDGRVVVQRQARDGANFSTTSGPIVVGDVIVLGGNGGSRGFGDHGATIASTPASARGYDVVTGRQLWEFSPIPPRDDPLRETWGEGSAEIAGDMAAWGDLCADIDLGLVYVPFSAPGPLAYGGWRPGDNAYSDSLLAIDVRTGKRVWHYQMIHHDLWDYDPAAPPMLGDIVVDGKPVKAVMQAGKNAFLYVFDRTTGKPVWPIEERPVPASDVPGESAAATQPIPSKPPAFDRQGFSDDDLIDFTPELRAKAKAIVAKYRRGPLYTPPALRTASVRGSLALPGGHGGGNWNTGAFDPERGVYYANSQTKPMSYALVPATSPGATMRFESAGDGVNIEGPEGLPLTKPPYGRITAIDMSKGTFLWTTPNADGPRDHPALRHLQLPRLGMWNGAAPLVTRTLLFLGEGSDAVQTGGMYGGWGRNFTAYDKNTGHPVASIPLPAGTTAMPMSYIAQGRQFIVVAIGGKDHDPELVALRLPEEK